MELYQVEVTCVVAENVVTTENAIPKQKKILTNQ